MDVQALRDLLRPEVGDMKDNGPDRLIPELCKSIGLPVPGPATEKRARMYAAFDALADAGVSGFAQGLLDKGLLSKPCVRNDVQDILWAARPEIDVSKRHRRELARALNKLERVSGTGSTPRRCYGRCSSSTPRSRECSAGDHETEWVLQHFFRNPEDADVEQLFEVFKAFDLSNHRFEVLLGGMVSADVQVDVDAQRDFAEVCNEVLRTCGAELRETAVEHGYPVFKLIAPRSANERPKTLIFASPEKPDLRFQDVLRNDVEFLSDPSKVLVYDRPIVDGLRWRDLQAWWADREAIAAPRRPRQACTAGCWPACLTGHHRSACLSRRSSRPSRQTCRACRPCFPRSGCTVILSRPNAAVLLHFRRTGWTF